MTETQAAAVAAPAETPTTLAPDAGALTSQAPSTDGAAAAPPALPKPSARELMQSLKSGAPAPQAEAPAAPEAAPQPEPASVTVDASGRAHGPDGKFIAQTNEGDAVQDGAEAPEGTDGPAAPEAPEGFVRIALPEGHPLRDRGREYIDAPKDQEDYHRWAINEPVRRAKLQEAETRAAQLEEQLLRFQAEQEARARSFEDPQIAAAWAKYQAVAEVDPEAAELLRAGIEQKIREQADGRFTEMSTERQQEAQREAVGQWIGAAYDQARTALPQEITQHPQFADLFESTFRAYEAEVDYRHSRGQAVEPSHGEFVKRLYQAAYGTEAFRPVLQQRLSAWQEQERTRIAQEAASAAEARARAEAADAERQRLEAAAQKRRTNPLGGMAMGLTTGRETFPQPGAPRNAKEFRASLRKV